MSKYTEVQIAEMKRLMRGNVHEMRVKHPMTDEQVKSAIERGDAIIDRMVQTSKEELEAMSRRELAEKVISDLDEVKPENKERVLAASEKILDDHENPPRVSLGLSFWLGVGLVVVGLGLWCLVIYKVIV